MVAMPATGITPARGGRASLAATGGTVTGRLARAAAAAGGQSAAGISGHGVVAGPARADRSQSLASPS